MLPQTSLPPTFLAQKGPNARDLIGWRHVGALCGQVRPGLTPLIFHTHTQGQQDHAAFIGPLPQCSSLSEKRGVRVS